MNYIPVFSNIHTNALITDFLLRGDYGNLPAIITVKDDTWDLYLPENAFKKLENEGYKFFTNAALIQRFDRETKEAAQKLKKLYHDLHGRKSQTFADFSRDFRQFTAQAIEMLKLYGLTEFYYYDKVEREYRELVANEYPHNPEQSVSRLLAGQLTSKNALLGQLTDRLRWLQAKKWQLRELLNEYFLGEDCLLFKQSSEFQQLTHRQDFAQLTINEIQTVLEGKFIEDKHHRIEHLAVKKVANNWIYFEKESAKKIIETVQKKDHHHQELTGQPAYHGLVRGRVRKHFFGETFNLESFEQGDILVASTTGPEFVPLMKKAAAIVTNEGGIMSHAAVVAREFQIPCIVGTKIATEVLHDGDLVEVDANQGIVRKISRK